MKKFSGAHGTATGFRSLLSIAMATPSQPSDGNPTDGGSDDDVWNFDRLLVEIVQWYDDTDAAFREGIKKSIKGGVSCDSCTEAVPGCCTQKVMVALYEVLPIVAYLHKAGLDTPELRERLRADGIAMEGTHRRDWFEEHHPCVFLKEGRCSIYRVRPVACRSYFVTSPPRNCGDNGIDHIMFVDHSVYLEGSIRKAFAIHKALDLKETRKRLLQGTLPRMLLLGLELFEVDDYQGFIRSQHWPTDENMGDWVEKGINPYRERLYQIRKSKDDDRSHSGGG